MAGQQVTKMGSETLKITAIPAFQDNYLWLMANGGTDCAVVDPGDGAAVRDETSDRGSVCGTFSSPTTTLTTSAAWRH
jgi:glyoxylase-like metal-dependent hydrolase (beta-lactamase superfamily II)